jgi:hypothetical protein
MHAATIKPARMEISMKKVLSSLTAPFGKIANNMEKRFAIFEQWIINHGGIKYFLIICK